jgi:hypothetical protein
MSETIDKIANAVERSLPDPTRPRLSESTEARFAPHDHKSAVAYAQAEAAADRLEAVTEAIESDGVPVEELLGDTSLVQHIQELRAIAREAEES